MTYDLVVIGAGIGGLNALYAAVQYLPKTARVLLLDQKDAAGGMWNTAYGYVRLHQPHPMFTVGDMAWNWRKPRGYLASRDEVQAHLASSLDVVGAKVRLETGFGNTVSTCAEVETDQGSRAEVTYHPKNDAQNPVTVLAKQAIFAMGINYQVPQPLHLSSQAVTSIAPADLHTTLEARQKAHVYVVGGGKTGMDTCLAALASPAQPSQRRVTLINGRGTHFINRDKYFPNGLARWTSGAMASRMFHDLGTTFDGTNEEDVITALRCKYSTDPTAPNGVFLYGIQSEEECATLNAGLTEKIQGYLDDVLDGPDGPQMNMRDGTQRPIEAGSVLVNCTGSFFKQGEINPHQNCLSPNGTILTITPRDSFHFLSSVAGFFLTHLLYRNKLRGTGYYNFDHETLFRMDRNAWCAASAAQGYLNQVIGLQSLPMTVLGRCFLDFDRWYPIPRRIVALFQMKATASQDILRCQRALDIVGDRFGIRMGPITAGDRR